MRSFESWGTSPSSRAKTARNESGRDDSLGKELFARRPQGGLFAFERFRRWAGTEKIAIAVNAVDAANRRPEFLPACPARGKGSAFARIRMSPFTGNHLFGGMWRIFQEVVFSICVARGDLIDLLADRDHRFAEAIELVFRFAFSRLDHNCARHRPRNRWSMEAIIH